MMMVYNSVVPVENTGMATSSLPYVIVFDSHTVLTSNSCTSRPDGRQCLVVQTPLHNISKHKPSTSTTHVACESELRSVVRSSMHPCPENWVTIGRAVVYNLRTAHAFNAGIKCQHCSPRIDPEALNYW